MSQEMGSMLNTKSKRATYWKYHIGHLMSAFTSWTLSSAYFLFLLLISTEATEGLVGKEAAEILFWMGIVGGMSMITTLEFIKFLAQEDRKVKWWIIWGLVGVSLITTAGKFLNDTQNVKNKQSGDTQSLQDLREQEDRYRAERGKVGYVANLPKTQAEYKAELRQYLESKAVNLNGNTASFTVEMALANPSKYPSYIHLKAHKEDLEEIIQHFNDYHSADTELKQVQEEIKAGGSGATRGGDALINAINDLVPNSSYISIALFIYLFLAVMIEAVGRYSGQEAFKARMILDGHEAVLLRMDVINKVGVDLVGINEQMKKLTANNEADMGRLTQQAEPSRRDSVTLEGEIRMSDNADELKQKYITARDLPRGHTAECPTCGTRNIKRGSAQIFCKDTDHSQLFHNRLNLLGWRYDGNAKQFVTL